MITQAEYEDVMWVHAKFALDEEERKAAAALVIKQAADELAAEQQAADALARQQAAAAAAAAPSHVAELQKWVLFHNLSRGKAVHWSKGDVNYIPFEYILSSKI